MMVWLLFAACAGVIMFAGAKLSKYGDMIASLTGLSRSWIGLVLVASVTSLPELITGLSSILLHDLPEIAAGDVLGSCMFNIGIIGLLDFLSRDRPILSAGSKVHILSGGFGIFLLALAGVSLLVSRHIPTLGWIGLHTPIILIIYFLAMRTMFKFEKDHPEESIGDEGDAEGFSKARAFTLYGINAVIVIAAASLLPSFGEKIAEMTGLEQSFVGTLFIALSTSLPEFVITYAALRRGAINLALGNLFGSNLFNVAILAVEDIAYRQDSLFNTISNVHAVTASCAIMMTAIALIGLAYGGAGKRFGIGWSSIALLLVFIAGNALSYFLGGKS